MTRFYKRVQVSDQFPAKSRSTAKLSMNQKNTSRKRKALSDETSSGDDRPLILSPPKQSKAVAISKPRAIQATTGPSSSVPIKRSRKSKLQESDEDSTQEDESPSDSDVAIAKKKPVKKRGASTKAKAPKKKAKVESGSDDDAILNSSKAKGRTKRIVKKVESDAESDKESEKPKAKPRAKKGNGKIPKDEDSPSKETKGAKSATVKAREDALKEEEAIYKWWEAKQAEGDNTVKWTTLEHNGVIFPAPYEPLPDHVKMKYNGQPTSGNIVLR